MRTRSALVSALALAALASVPMGATSQASAPTAPAPTTGAPRVDKARPEERERVVRRDPLALQRRRRRAKPLPHERTDFDIARLLRAQYRRILRAQRPQGWTR